MGDGCPGLTGTSESIKLLGCLYRNIRSHSLVSPHRVPLFISSVLHKCLNCLRVFSRKGNQGEVLGFFLFFFKVQLTVNSLLIFLLILAGASLLNSHMQGGAFFFLTLKNKHWNRKARCNQMLSMMTNKIAQAHANFLALGLELELIWSSLCPETRLHPKRSPHLHSTPPSFHFYSWLSPFRPLWYISFSIALLM